MGLRVLIVQHGEKEREPGDPGLTARGRAQAEASADWICARARPVAVHTSPYRRAVETAAPLVAATGLELVTDPRLRERLNWDGGPFDRFAEDWRRTSSDRSFVPRTGDSSHDAADRFVAALDDLAAAHAEGVAVVVAHGGVTVDVLRTLLGEEAVWADAPDLVAEGVPPGAVTTLVHDDGRWSVVSLPDAAHLEEVT